MTSLYLDVLNKPGRDLLPKLSLFNKNGGVLAGGTAIALQIRHRVSQDFDIFLPTTISPSLESKLRRLLGQFLLKQFRTRNQLTVIGPHQEKVTLVTYLYPPLHPLVETGSLPLFALPDLATNKAYTIGRRGLWRDYIDIYFLLKDDRLTLTQIISEASQRFKDEFSPKLFLEQLIYTKDLPNFEVTFLRDEASPSRVISFLESQVKNYLRT